MADKYVEDISTHKKRKERERERGTVMGVTSKDIFYMMSVHGRA
jgi:hypothetical protein